MNFILELYVLSNYLSFSLINQGERQGEGGRVTSTFCYFRLSTIKKMVIWDSSASCEGTSVDSKTLSPECFFSSSVCGVDCPSVLTPQVKVLRSPLG